MQTFITPAYEHLKKIQYLKFFGLSCSFAKDEDGNVTIVRQSFWPSLLSLPHALIATCLPFGKSAVCLQFSKLLTLFPASF